VGGAGQTGLAGSSIVLPTSRPALVTNYLKAWQKR
jgi:hypothetical protein